MRLHMNEAMTYSTLEDQRRHFTGRPWHFSIAPKGNVMPAGKYRVVNGILQKIGPRGAKEAQRNQPDRS